MAQQPHPVYHRTPIPAQAQPRTGWTILCWMLIVFSPFIGFAVHGKVVEAGLITGLWVALLPVCALVMLHLRHRAAVRRVPAALLAERRHGRLIGPEGAPPVTPPLRYASARHAIELLADGVVITRNALLNLHNVGSFSEYLIHIQTAEAAGQYFVPWTGIEEWVVEADSDGADFYRLILGSQGAVRVLRFRATTGDEADLLDAVRAIGRVPVRLRDDLASG